MMTRKKLKKDPVSITCFWKKPLYPDEVIGIVSISGLG